MQNPRQLNLFDHVTAAYGQPRSGKLTNTELYRMVAGRAGISKEILNEKKPIGVLGQRRSIVKRSIRWAQQSLKQAGVIAKVDGERGAWELTEFGKSKLRKVPDGISMIGFSTDLGIAILSNCNSVFDNWSEPIFCAITSPPYPLQVQRAYGNPNISEYTDFICRSLEGIVKNLVPGGNIVLSLSNDIFLTGSPARSTYLEELTIALTKRLGLFLMDRVIWESNKPPGPIQWASKERMQLNTGFEFLLWFCNDPNACIADNRRVLEEHTDAHKKLMRNGGEKRNASYSDGAYRIREGSYGTMTDGRIPRNILKVSNVCANQRTYKRNARALGLQAHGAPMPLELVRKLIRFMTDVGQLVVDPFSGSVTTGLGAQLENRRWAATDNIYDYVRGAATRFSDFAGYELNLPELSFFDLAS